MKGQCKSYGDHKIAIFLNTHEITPPISSKTSFLKFLMVELIFIIFILKKVGILHNLTFEQKAYYLPYTL